MIKFKSLQTRLLVAFACLSFVICIFFIRLSTLLIETAEINAYQLVLANEEQRLLNTTNTELLKARLNTVLYSNLDTVPNEIVSEVENKQSGSFETKDGQHFIFRAFLLNKKPHLLLMNLNSFAANQYLVQYKSLFLYSISVSAFILCLLSSWYLSKWLSRPIVLLTQNVAQRDLNHTEVHYNIAPIAMYGAGRADEIGMLAKALDESYQNIQTLLLREQNFTRDVSHELRTPITIIKNTLAIKTKGAISKGEQETLQYATKELEQTVEILLALARQENLVFAELKVLPIVENTLLKLYHLHPDFPFDASVDIPSQMQATGNELLFGLLCQNLVNNALYHGNGSSMTIRASGTNIIFENALDMTPHRPINHGLGHGQYLVKRIANEMKWSVSAEQDEGIYRVVVSTIS